MQEQTKNKINYKILVMMLLLWTVLVAGLFLGYNYWSQYVQERSKMHNKISDLDTKLDSTHDKIHKYIDQTNDTPLSESALLPVKTALILTQLAEEKLHETKDARLAQSILRAAQTNLDISNDQHLVQVKAMLVADQEKLSAVKAIDVVSLTNKLDNLEAMVGSLPLKGASAAKQQQQMEAAQENANKWQQVLSSVRNNAKSVVKVRQKSEIDAAMSQVGKDVQIAHLKILVSQIRWSIYYRDASVYQYGLQKLADLAMQLYDGNSSEVQKFQQILVELAMAEVNTEVPDISDTIKTLQAILVR